MAVELVGYQLNVPLTKKMYEEHSSLYQLGCILIRIDKLQNESMRMKRCNKPTSSGTLMTFEKIKTATECEEETRKIILAGEAVGMKFETMEQKRLDEDDGK